MLANARAVIGERQDVLTVPAAALVYRTPEEVVVMVRGADGRAREQQVAIGLNDGILAEVLSGLSEGQTVLVPLVPPGEPFGPGPIPLR
jgi:macrolide-specific efflux system membrane fusion protein